MEPTGVLQAIVALAVYPGALLLAIATTVHSRLAGAAAPRAGAAPGTVSWLATALAATAACAMLPLQGSPAMRLPAAGGATGNLVAVVVLLGVAVELAAPSRRLVGLAAAAAMPVIALASASSSVSVQVVDAVGGPLGTAARDLAAILLILAASLAPAGGRSSVVAAALGLAGAALVVPAALPDAPPVLGAVACLAVVAAAGLLARLRGRWPAEALAAVGVVTTVAGTVTALLSGRG